MKLRHYHFPGLIRYQTAASLQDKIVAQFLALKASSSKTSQSDGSGTLHQVSRTDGATSDPAALATPSVITAQFHPVYTCGRREVGKVTSAQERHLRAGGRADFVEALRGGQTTFHGPGQLVAYPILDLKDGRVIQSHEGMYRGAGEGLSEKRSRRQGNITAREYVSILEQSVIATCAAYGVKAFTTEHPGVWTTPEKKIAALGVHLRRHVTSHGIGLNVNTDLWWFDRIVACGLEGKKTTSLAAEGAAVAAAVRGTEGGMREVATVFVDELAKGLGGVDEVEVVECVGSEEP